MIQDPNLFQINASGPTYAYTSIYARFCGFSEDKD
jgi:hypothetical protein